MTSGFQVWRPNHSATLPPNKNNIIENALIYVKSSLCQKLAQSYEKSKSVQKTISICLFYTKAFNYCYHDCEFKCQLLVVLFGKKLSLTVQFFFNSTLNSRKNKKRWWSKKARYRMTCSLSLLRKCIHYSCSKQVSGLTILIIKFLLLWIKSITVR